MIKAWDELPDNMKLSQVKPYYDIISEKKASLFFKRVFDIVASFVLLILLLPVFLVLAAAIKADSRGPVFFRQTRVTQYGKKFRIFKFRTMVNGAEKLGTQVTVGNDSRITRVGSFIRNSRLDEIPQLINVLVGDMSFVGTRPEVPKYVEKYSPEMMATLLLPAGVTSKASIYYKDEADILENSDNPDETYVSEILPKKMECNLQSIKQFSFFDDIRVMFMTVFAVLGKDYKAE